MISPHQHDEHKVRETLKQVSSLSRRVDLGKRADGRIAVGEGLCHQRTSQQSPPARQSTMWFLL